MDEKINMSGWDAITKEFERIYPEQKNPKHYATLIGWRLGGPDSLNGISIYESEDAYHFVTYGMSELYEKETSDMTYSGFGMEFTFRLKKSDYKDTEAELRCVAGILQSLARLTFLEGEIFLPYEYVYTGQTNGIDVDGLSDITGFITIPDTKAHTLKTENGQVEFVEFIGVTDRELKMIIDKKIGVEELYKKIGSDITNYDRKSCF